MRIIVVNRDYFVAGGPGKYMSSLIKGADDHEFIPFSVNWKQTTETPYSKYFLDPPINTDGLYFKDFNMSWRQKLGYAFDSVYNWEARRKLETLIAETQPNAALFLNAVYFSDSIIDACRTFHLPLIWRLSDYHKICVNYFLYRDGHICEDCLKHGPIMAIKNACAGYQRSFAGSIIKACGMYLARWRNSYESIEYFVTPSEFTRQKMIQAGFPANKVVNVPTFVDLNGVQSCHYPAKPSVLYAGRLTPEKGVHVLIEAFLTMENRDVLLTITGDTSTAYAQGLIRNIPEIDRERIRFIGFVGQERMHELYSDHSVLVVPSLWYENMPNVVLEGMVHDRPTIVSRLGSFTELIRDGETGYCFAPGDARDLSAKLTFLLDNRGIAEETGKRAGAYVREKHRFDIHLKALIGLFETVFRTRHDG
jgi:glycosyltransferase involved in cell wall biosynthesis